MKYFHFPALPEHYLDRERIRRRLEQNTGVCFLSAWQGCGKTSALARFLKGKEKEAFWYSFQKEDNLEAVFQKNLKYAAERFRSLSDASAADMLRGLLEQPEISYYVFDCLQELSNEKMLCVLREFLEENAGRHKIFLAGSDYPPSCFSRFLASGIYDMISGEELCFTPREAGELIRIYLKKPDGWTLQEECAAHLMKLTGGWPAAAAFLLRFVRSHDISMENFLRMRETDALLDTMLYDYIDYEIYGRFSAKEKMLLAQMAEFRNPDPDLICCCLGKGARSGILRKLRRRNLLCRPGSTRTEKSLAASSESEAAKFSDTESSPAASSEWKASESSRAEKQLAALAESETAKFSDTESSPAASSEWKVAKSSMAEKSPTASSEWKASESSRAEKSPAASDREPGSCRGITACVQEQYVPLLRLFLQEQTTQAQKIKIRQQAGVYYLKAGDFAEAFYYSKDNPDAVRAMLLQYGRKMMERQLYGLMEQCLCILKQETAEWSTKELELAAEFYYRTGNRQRMEACLNAADSMFGKENRYGMYRSLYRGLFHYKENPEKYKELVNNAMFFLEENKIPFPYFMESERQLLREIRMEKEGDKRADGGRKIKVSAFGTFRAVVIPGGKELPWRTKKGCELFAYLLERNGEPVERKTLLAQLWKEELPNHAVAMLHNMIYNIRKELSYYSLEHMIQYKNKKYVMNTEIIQSDLEQVRTAAGCVEKKDTAGLMRLKNLFDVPWGLYLEDLDNVWIRERQEYYQKIFEKGCLMIGEACAGQRMYEQAAVYFKNALAVNCYSEKIMGMLLTCYGQTGQLRSAKKQYQEFCVLLKKDLDIVPGDELRDRYRECVLCGSRT